ncbi:class I SAM-dependent methyltransferase [Candidatus Electrothrix sp.]|uniref:class I SAM-dependent methyltransferase n=1 Tax=Candidatus Electrothrix sp. TaxID=2170559 RepID=UPI00405631FB
MLKKYFKRLYQRTMHEAYSRAHDEIVNALQNGGTCLDCGAHSGYKYDLLNKRIGIDKSRYNGIEWNANAAQKALDKGLNVLQGDLNKDMERQDEFYKCIFGLSVLEHLLNPCNYLRECYRCLEKDGVLVILTPNISTYFTSALILAGKMPSSGPHPDSDALLKKEELFRVSNENLQPDTETDTPVHRHLVVFSYKVLKSYLSMLGFEEIRGYGYGLYPFPNFMQKPLEKLDPYHCHQMVFVGRK